MKLIKKFLTADKIGIISQIDPKAVYKIEESLSEYSKNNEQEVSEKVTHILNSVIEKLDTNIIEQKENKITPENKTLANILPPETYKWLGELVELGKESWTDEDYLKHVKMDLFQDRIFVITPKNDSIDLPDGATILDFAYKIHRQVGETAYMGKINGEVAKLGSKLKNGDMVEIITQKNQTPKPGWLEWVITAQAARQIRNYLRKVQK